MKVIILIYVHGFKGDETTFSAFPSDIQQCLTNIYPSSELAIRTVIYPPYETKGELSSAVTSLLNFTEATVIDAEVALGTPSPVVTPAVGVVFVAHSMGGLVVTDATLQILARDRAVLFPKITGILCYDSPFLGLHSSVFAQDVLSRGTAKFNELKGLGAAIPVSAVTSFLFAQKSSEQPSREGKTEKKQVNWGKVAGLTAAGIATTAAAAAGTAWYLKSQNVDVNWAKDHLLFVGALFQKPQILKDRLWTLYQARLRIRMINYYTLINQKKDEFSNDSQQKDPTVVMKGIGKLMSGEGDGTRTFCNVPKEAPYTEFFVPTENPLAKGEIEAHVNIFEQSKNPNYQSLVGESVERISGYINDWINA
ncbi:hypothetical protein V1514DRAFT_324043 [Lipomyces japonicus]|uniref:uncharacterized protein n=1 Tax=Lipomyces japonicus TaxID=56871 RepID=UPI0034CE4290